MSDTVDAVWKFEEHYYQCPLCGPDGSVDGQLVICGAAGGAELLMKIFRASPKLPAKK